MPWIYKNFNYNKANFKLCCIILFLFYANNYIFAQTTQLAAPTISVENPIEVSSPDFSLSWDALDETHFYIFELCQDAACSLKIKTIPKAGKPSVVLSNIENGQYFWRVSGIDDNNLSGEYSTPQPLLVTIISTPIQAEPQSESSPEAPEERKLQEQLLHFPWYIYLIILAYIIFIVRTLLWYINK